MPKDRALGVIAGITLCNEGTIRDWIRHGHFNVTQGKDWDFDRQHRAVDETDVDLTKPLHLICKITAR